MGSTGGGSDSFHFGAFFVLLSIIWLALAIVMIIAWVKIISREGYSGAWVLIALVPLLNVVMFLVFAFKESPAQRELKQLRAWAASAGPPGPPMYGGGSAGYR
ncbi:hypothetical protein [Flexivirga caeni]|uniref:Uncharacterized protein n=1 Tax=Flexivirga caeni TaxID=2294115 RepID=A0A3M9ML63_9MICO|nr:hypothetical protein [Flexivirga caeni]RNI25408.1 hypothetical protein EFY87_01945 [Flexivirga caeni]